MSVTKSILDMQVATDGIRKTRELPPRISVYDVIAKVKGCSSNYAGNVFRRMLDSGSVPECDEVSPNLFEEAVGQGGTVAQCLWRQPKRSCRSAAHFQTTLNIGSIALASW